MSEAKRCPFCDAVPRLLDDGMVICPCGFGDGLPIDLETWNTRPYETRLVESLADHMDWVNRLRRFLIWAIPWTRENHGVRFAGMLQQHGLDPVTLEPRDP